MGLAGEPVLDGEPDPRGRFGEDPLELLLRLQSVTGARYAGKETIRETRCRKATVSDGTARFTVWVDGEHVRQVQAVAAKTRTMQIKGDGTATVTIEVTVTVELRDFGPPASSLDWTGFSSPAA